MERKADAGVLPQPTCVGGMCVNIFAEGLFNCRIPFYVFPPGVEQEKGNEVGSIVKIFGGLSTELFTDADKFEVRLELPSEQTSRRSHPVRILCRARSRDAPRRANLSGPDELPGCR
jgi:hypothetical protein